MVRRDSKIAAEVESVKENRRELSERGCLILEKDEKTIILQYFFL